MNLSGFRPPQQKSAQVRFRCAVYSELRLGQQRQETSRDSALVAAVFGLKPGTRPGNVLVASGLVPRGRFNRPEPNSKGSLEMASTTKTAIVTGASQGIGAGLVEAFLNRGYNVVANSRHITQTNPFAASESLVLIDGDIGDPTTAAKIVDTAVSKFGRIDVLINNAGIFIPKPFTEYTTADLDALVSTTLAGFLYVTQLTVK